MVETTDTKVVWKKILKELFTYIPKSQFLTWFKNTALLELEESTLVIGVPTSISSNNILGKYMDMLVEASEKVMEKTLHVKIVVDGSLHRKDERVIDIVRLVRQCSDETEGKTSTEVEKLDQFDISEEARANIVSQEIPLVEGITSRLLNPTYTFEEYVIAPETQLAYAACLAVSRAPGVAYNPLFIYGGVGLGKTHLLQAIGNEVLRRFPKKKIVYLTSEKFTNEIVMAIQKRNTEELRKRYRSIDVLIIDDIQFLANKVTTQIEFFHTFNELYQDKKQIILSSDRPPKELSELEGRLTSRFESGMIVDVGFPDFETRCAILRKKALKRGVHLSNDVLEFIAHNVLHSIRELEGVLNQALAMYELSNITPTISTIGPLLQKLNKTNSLAGYTNGMSKKGRATKLSEVVEKTSIFFHISSEEILGESRKKDIAHARQIIMYIAKNDLDMTFERIGEELGGRLHSTVIHSCTKISEAIKTDDNLSRDINSIRHELGLL